jgi:hypothetical protein
MRVMPIALGDRVRGHGIGRLRPVNPFNLTTERAHSKLVGRAEPCSPLASVDAWARVLSPSRGRTAPKVSQQPLNVLTSPLLTAPLHWLDSAGVGLLSPCLLYETAPADWPESLCRCFSFHRGTLGHLFSSGHSMICTGKAAIGGRTFLLHMKAIVCSTIVTIFSCTRLMNSETGVRSIDVWE